MNGSTLIASDYTDLWNGNIQSPINVDEYGATNITVNPLTGSEPTGVKRDRHLGGDSATPSKVEYGDSTKTNGYWALIFNGNASSSYHYYAMSEPIRLGTSITMTATTASDSSGVEYYFTETTGNAGGDDSGWQNSPTYIDSGLHSGLTYSYKVKARDTSISQNETGESSEGSVSVGGTVSSPYDTWKDNYLGLSNNDASIDFDNGGLPTGIEWVLGSDPTNHSDDKGVAPEWGRLFGSYIFNYRRTDTSNADANTTITVEYSNDLSNWTTATHGGLISIIESNDDVAVGIDKVTVVLAPDVAEGDKIFARLKVVIVP